MLQAPHQQKGNRKPLAAGGGVNHAFDDEKLLFQDLLLCFGSTAFRSCWRRAPVVPLNVHYGQTGCPDGTFSRSTRLGWVLADGSVVGMFMCSSGTQGEGSFQFPRGPK